MEGRDGEGWVDCSPCGCGCLCLPPVIPMHAWSRCPVQIDAVAVPYSACRVSTSLPSPLPFPVSHLYSCNQDGAASPPNYFTSPLNSLQCTHALYLAHAYARSIVHTHCVSTFPRHRLFPFSFFIQTNPPHSLLPSPFSKAAVPDVDAQCV